MKTSCELYEELKKALIAEAAEDGLKDISDFCGDFYREDWNPADMVAAYDGFIKIFGDEDSVRILILYTFGFLLAKGQISIKENRGPKVRVISKMEPAEESYYEEGTVTVANLEIEVLQNADTTKKRGKWILDLSGTWTWEPEETPAPIYVPIVASCSKIARKKAATKTT